MKAIREFVKTTAVGGIVFLVPMTASRAARLQDRELLSWMVVINLAFLAIRAWVWQLEGRNLWLTAAAHLGLQAFAALVMHTARRAEDMAERLRATNAELHTTFDEPDFALRAAHGAAFSRAM